MPKVYLDHPYWDERVISSEDFAAIGLPDEPELRVKPNGVGVDVSQAVFDYLMTSEDFFTDKAPKKSEKTPVEIPPEGLKTDPEKAKAKK